MITGILTGAPLWVWPLLALLLFMGIRASKTRQVPKVLFYVVPLLGLISINTIAGLKQPSLAWSVYILAYGIGVFLGYAKQADWLISKQDNNVTLAGEWVTLATMMTLFWMNFLAQTVRALNPELYADRGFLVGFVFITALAGGSFLGRALKIFRY